MKTVPRFRAWDSKNERMCRVTEMNSVPELDHSSVNVLAFKGPSGNETRIMIWDQKREDELLIMMESPFTDFSNPPRPIFEYDVLQVMAGEYEGCEALVRYMDGSFFGLLNRETEDGDLVMDLLTNIVDDGEVINQGAGMDVIRAHFASRKENP